MKYMQNGGFQYSPLMRLTLGLTILLLACFVVTNFALYFAKMNLAPISVASYYNGSEEEFRPARTFQSMLEVTHSHLPMMALILLLLTHLLIFAPFSKVVKIWFIVIAFISGLFNEASGWLIRFVDPAFAWLKVISFITLQASLIILLLSLGVFLFRAGDPTTERSREHGTEKPPSKKSEGTKHPRVRKPAYEIRSTTRK